MYGNQGGIGRGNQESSGYKQFGGSTANDNQMGQQKRKNRRFEPVSMLMINKAVPRPNDECEIEGELINDVSILGNTII